MPEQNTLEDPRYHMDKSNLNTLVRLAGIGGGIEGTILLMDFGSFSERQDSLSSVVLAKESLSRITSDQKEAQSQANQGAVAFFNERASRINQHIAATKEGMPKDIPDTYYIGAITGGILVGTLFAHSLGTYLLHRKWHKRLANGQTAESTESVE